MFSVPDAKGENSADEMRSDEENPKSLKPASWADQVEQGEGQQFHSKSLLSGDTKIVVEYTKNSEGKSVKIIRHYKIQKVLTTKTVAKRKQKWKKYGMAENDPPGPNPANTIVAEEIFMFFLNADSEQEEKEEKNPLNRLKLQKLVKCRICKGDHWTTQCPYKNKMDALPDELKQENKPQAAKSVPAEEAEEEEKPKSAKYVPPSLRGRTNKLGETMPVKSRDNLPTIRVTNLPEETCDTDMHDLFRPFGMISRIYLAKDKSTGLCKGFAFVSYLHKDDAITALKTIDGYGYQNLILHAEWARPTTKQ